MQGIFREPCRFPPGLEPFCKHRHHLLSSIIVYPKERYNRTAIFPLNSLDYLSVFRHTLRYNIIATAVTQVSRRKSGAGGPGGSGTTGRAHKSERLQDGTGEPIGGECRWHRCTGGVYGNRNTV